jgi:hypothetical protein
LRVLLQQLQLQQFLCQQEPQRARPACKLLRVLPAVCQLLMQLHVSVRHTCCWGIVDKVAEPLHLRPQRGHLLLAPEQQQLVVLLLLVHAQLVVSAAGQVLCYMLGAVFSSTETLCST